MGKLGVLGREGGLTHRRKTPLSFREHLLFEETPAARSGSRAPQVRVGLLGPGAPVTPFLSASLHCHSPSSLESRQPASFFFSHWDF